MSTIKQATPQSHSAVAGEDGEQSEDRDVKPDQCDHETEAEVPLELFGCAGLDAGFDGAEVEYETQCSCLGAISAMFDAQTDGIVGAAVLSTVCVFIASLVLFATRIVKPTQKLAFAVIAGVGGFGLLYFFVFVLSIFNWGWLYSDNFRSIGVVVTIVAIVLCAVDVDSRPTEPRPGEHPASLLSTSIARRDAATL